MEQTLVPTVPQLAKRPSGAIDHLLTGHRASAFRKLRRIKAIELAPKLGFANSSSITHAESGRFVWTQEFLDRYVRGVDELLAGNRKKI